MQDAFQDTFKSIICDKPWMTPEERKIAEFILDNVFADFAKKNVEPTTFILMRVEGIISTYLFTRRLERRIPAIPPEPVPIKNPEPEPAPPARAAAAKNDEVATVEAAAKSHEQLRKAIKEFEESCAKSGIPVPKLGLPDYMKPILEKAQGILEECLEPDLTPQAP